MKPRVLVVDDHRMVRAGLASVLSTNWGYEVCGEAENGLEAISKVRELKPDVVLLDLSMPVMSGTAAARHIRQLAPATKIIFLSMHESASVAELEKLVGADAGLSKSSPIEELHETIIALLKIPDPLSFPEGHPAKEGCTVERTEHGEFETRKKAFFGGE